jgi:hypothetical protein
MIQAPKPFRLRLPIEMLKGSQPQELHGLRILFFAFHFQISFPNMTLRKIHIPYSNLVLDPISSKSILLALTWIQKGIAFV